MCILCICIAQWFPNDSIILVERPSDVTLNGLNLIEIEHLNETDNYH